MNYEEIIKTMESIGLNKSETMIYLDLVKSGKSSAIGISKRTKIHRPNVYDTLDKLIEKGIVTQNIEENRKVFYPIKPANLLNYLKQKEFDLKKIIPQIEGIHNKPAEQRRIVMSEGIRSFRAMLNNLLELNQSILAYGIPKDASEIIGGFINDFHKRRIEQKIEMKHIYNRDADKRMRALNKMEHTKARYLPSLYDSETTTLICGDKVLLIFWKDPVSTIVIENKSIAKTYQQYFDIIWEEAKIEL